ncbi:MAG: spore maturation protein, partial [Oscillospiraceae bacterium]|nr:spore maturation protein [Oscillospiraceae bacterium]
MNLSDFVVPAFVSVVFVYGVYKRVDVFEAFVEGASENIKTAFDILPALIILMTVISMLNASGIVSFVSDSLSPVLSEIGFPGE